MAAKTTVFQSNFLLFDWLKRLIFVNIERFDHFLLTQLQHYESYKEKSLNFPSCCLYWWLVAFVVMRDENFKKLLFNFRLMLKITKGYVTLLQWGAFKQKISLYSKLNYIERKGERHSPKEKNVILSFLVRNSSILR